MVFEKKMSVKDLIEQMRRELQREKTKKVAPKAPAKKKTVKKKAPAKKKKRK